MGRGGRGEGGRGLREEEVYGCRGNGVFGKICVKGKMVTWWC